MPRRVLDHQLLQEINVALQAARPLVEPGGLGAVLYPSNVLGSRDVETADDQPAGQRQPDNRDFEHLVAFWLFLSVCWFR
jgi:hypothetical protein